MRLLRGLAPEPAFLVLGLSAWFRGARPEPRRPGTAHEGRCVPGTGDVARGVEGRCSDKLNSLTLGQCTVYTETANIRGINRYKNCI